MENGCRDCRPEVDELEELLVPSGVITRSLRIQWQGRCTRVEVDLPVPASPDEGEHVDANLLSAVRLWRLVQMADAKECVWRGVMGARLFVWAEEEGCGWSLKDAEGNLLEEEYGWEGVVRLLDDLDSRSVFCVFNP